MQRVAFERLVALVTARGGVPSLAGEDFAVFRVGEAWALVDGRGDGKFCVLAGADLSRSDAAALADRLKAGRPDVSVELVVDSAVDVWVGRTIRHRASEHGLAEVVDTVLAAVTR